MRGYGSISMLGRRFLLSKHSDRFLSFITLVSVFGVALGVTALTVVTSVINGFEGELVRVITSVNGDVILYSRSEAVHRVQEISDQIKETLPQTVAVSGSFFSEIMVSCGHGVSGAVLQGVDTKTIGQVTDLPKTLVSGRMPAAAHEVVMGSELAQKVGAQLGDSVRLIVPFLGEARTPKVLRATVVGIARLGMYQYDSKFLFMTLASVQEFLGQPGAVTHFTVKLASGVDARLAARKLGEQFSYPLSAKFWGDLNRNLFRAIQLEKVVIAIILTVIVIVSAFNVVSTLMMMIHDKSKEIAILKAMGFRPSQSFLLFCLIGVGIGAVGTALGVVSGLGLGALLEKTRWIELPADIYYIGFLPMSVRWAELGLIVAGALMISFASTLYPSWKVSRQSAMEGLRYE